MAHHALLTPDSARRRLLLLRGAFCRRVSTHRHLRALVMSPRVGVIDGARAPVEIDATGGANITSPGCAYDNHFGLVGVL